MKKNSKNYTIVKNADGLGAVLGLSQSDTALLKYKALWRCSQQSLCG